MLPRIFPAAHHASIAPAVLAASLGFASTANADQSGTPFWISGQFASLAAVPPSPGWSVNLTAYGYNGSVSAEKQLPIGRAITLGARERSPSLSIEPGYAPSQTLLGGQPFISMSFGLGGNRVQADVTVSGFAAQVNRTDSLWAGTDLYPFASLGWTHGNDNWMAYLTGDIPTGAYQASRLANTGIGHGAIDAGGSYTYYHANSEMEFSATAGLTYNWENTHTDYKNGIDSHLDWAASRFVSPNWELGVAGYVYYQLTGDSGSGAKLGPFKSHVAAVGPEIGYQFTVGGQQWYANLRGYWEFWAQNRYEGYAIFATLNIPFGSGK